MRLYPKRRPAAKPQAGFSLIELMFAMAITLIVLGMASALLGRSFNVRTRENLRTDALADVQRALNIMSREIANAGYGVDTLSNGIVPGDSDTSSIRIWANTDRYSTDASVTDTMRSTISGAGEDIKYLVYEDETNDQSYLVRYDNLASSTEDQKTVLANRITGLTITYKTDAGATTTDETAAQRVLITVGVHLDAVGTFGVEGYQPAQTVVLTSEVALRNTTDNLRRY
ncbi:MAG: prepilin-type N-terminal cleavage/methylation domain-containing protein [Pyrinomonadaceae bacterium]